MTDEALRKALVVMDAYMAGINHGDEVAVNAACNFPHVWIARGQVMVWPNRGDYKLDVFHATAGDGWARSQWDEIKPLHVAETKVHFQVKFTRYRGDGSVLGEFETIYIVTRQDGHWGIQARSSFAS